MSLQKVAVMCSGGTSAVMNPLLSYLFYLCNFFGTEVYGIRNGWRGLVEGDIIKITTKDIAGISSIPGGTLLHSCTKFNTFDHNGLDLSGEAYKVYKQHDFSAIIVLGGDGSAKHANHFGKTYPDMKFIWISATLDRDVMETEHTNGFYSAALNAVESAMAMILDSITMQRHCIVEMMGRNAGDLTAYVAYCIYNKYRRKFPKKQPPINLVILPEFDFDFEKVKEMFRKSPTPLVVLISEGIKLPGEVEEEEVIAGHHKNLANTCEVLKELLKEESKLAIRTMTVGYLQRAGKIAQKDKIEAARSAWRAVKYMSNRKELPESVAVVRQRGTYRTISLSDLVEKNLNVSMETRKCRLSRMSWFKEIQHLVATL